MFLKVYYYLPTYLPTSCNNNIHDDVIRWKVIHIVQYWSFYPPPFTVAGKVSAYESRFVFYKVSYNGGTRY